MGAPYEIRYSDIIGLKASGDVQTLSNGLVEPGMMLTDPDQQHVRMHFGTAVNDAIYFRFKPAAYGIYREAGVFQQSRGSYASDMGVGTNAAGIAKRLSATKKIIQGFLDVYVGCMCLNPVIGWAKFGMDVAIATGKVTANWKKYEDALVALYCLKESCPKRMPKFYMKVVSELMLGQLENMVQAKGIKAVTDRIPGPEFVGGMVGVFIGAAGEDMLKFRLGIIKDFFVEVLLKIATHAMEHNQKLDQPVTCMTQEQVDLLAEHHVRARLKKTDYGIPPTMDEAREIVREMARCWNLRKDLQRVADLIEML